MSQGNYFREQPLSAIALVTGYRVRGKGVPHFGKGVPTIKYEFLAFDRRRTMEKPAGAQPVCNLAKACHSQPH